MQQLGFFAVLLKRSREVPRIPISFRRIIVIHSCILPVTDLDEDLCCNLLGLGWETRRLCAYRKVKIPEATHQLLARII